MPESQIALSQSQQIGEMLGLLRSLHEKVDRQSDAHDDLDTEVRQMSRDSARADATRQQHDNKLESIGQELASMKAEVAKLTELRSRLFGMLFVFSLIGGGVVALIQPILSLFPGHQAH